MLASRTSTETVPTLQYNFLDVIIHIPLIHIKQVIANIKTHYNFLSTMTWRNPVLLQCLYIAGVLSCLDRPSLYIPYTDTCRALLYHLLGVPNITVTYTLHTQI